VLNTLLGFVTGYLLGAIPSAFLISKLKKQNVFEVGSGNMGTMNVARNLGFGLGALVLLMDLGKGVLASYLGLLLSSDVLIPAYAASVGALLGHAYSVFVGFRGGKGLATSLGVALQLYALGGVITLVVLVALTLFLKGRSNLAGAVAAVAHTFIVGLSLIWQPAPSGNGFFLLGSVALVSMIVFIKHVPGVQSELKSTGAL